MRIVLDDGNPVGFAESKDAIHFAADAGIMDGDDGSCARGNEASNLLLINVQRIRADVAEDRARATQHERINRGDECEGRNDDFVAGLNIEKKRGHLQRIRARGCQKSLGNSESFFEKLLTFCCKVAVSGNVGAFKRLKNVAKLVAGKTRSIEWDAISQLGTFLLPCEDLRELPLLIDSAPLTAGSRSAIDI